MKVNLPSYIKDHAHQAALMTSQNPGSPEYKKAFNEFLTEFYEHTQIGRKSNPSTAGNEALVKSFPDVFSNEGFLKNSKNKTAYQQRILGAVKNLAHVVLEIQLEFKTHQDETAMSIFQLPKNANEKQIKDMLIANYYRTLVSTLVLESLIPLFSMGKDEFIEIMESTQPTIENLPVKNLKEESTVLSFISGIKHNLDVIFSKMKMKMIVFGKEAWRKS